MLYGLLAVAHFPIITFMVSIYEIYNWSLLSKKPVKIFSLLNINRVFFFNFFCRCQGWSWQVCSASGLPLSFVPRPYHWLEHSPECDWRLNLYMRIAKFLLDPEITGFKGRSLNLRIIYFIILIIIFFSFLRQGLLSSKLASNLQGSLG